MGAQIAGLDVVLRSKVRDISPSPNRIEKNDADEDPLDPAYKDACAGWLEERPVWKQILSEDSW